MSELFKERVNKSYSEDFARELLSVLEAPQSLEGVLFGDTEHKAYIIAGQYTLGDHSKIQCSGFNDGPLEKREKRICKCLYYFNNKKIHNCDYCFHRNACTNAYSFSNCRKECIY